MISLKQAILDTAARILPEGYNVSDDAPQTFEQLKALLDSGQRICVWSGGSEETVYGDPQINYAFRAWHDLNHYKASLPFTFDGEMAVCEMQCRELLSFYGDNEHTQSWCAILEAEVIGQAEYYRIHKRFPEDQRGFVATYLKDPQFALMWPFW